MPALYLMSWEPKQRLWRKMYKGQRYVISCRQLNAPETKEGSYQAANAWWTAKRAEIDGQQPPHPHAEEIAEFIGRRDWARRHGENNLAAFLDRQAKILERNPSAPSVMDLNRDLRVKVLKEAYGLDPGTAPPELLTDDRIWEDRLTRDDTEPVPDDETIGGQANRWLSRQEARVKAGNLSPGAYANTRDCLHHFRDWLGSELSVGTINENKIEDYHTYLLGKIGERESDPGRKRGWSRDYCKKTFGIARAFVRYLWEKGLIPLPKNIESRQFRFGVGPQVIITMTNEEIRMLVGNATGQLGLHLLLMLNCGMTQTDIADLEDSEVEWEHGIITRKRSKTGDKAKVPVVAYKLWPITFDLLKRHRTGGPIVLLTHTGGRWAWEELGADGKVHSSDNIATNYNRLRKKIGVTKSLRVFRKTSATRLKGHRNYGQFHEYFLGHAPRTIADRHYSDTQGGLFNEAVEWLGQQYGFLS